MVFIKALALLVLPCLVVAQYSTEPETYGPSSSETETETYGPSDTETYLETSASPSASPSASASASATVSAPSNVPSAPPNTPGHINIDVGFSQTLTYNPPNITAPNGTLVTFFFPKSVAHSVTQSSFGEPCTHLAASGDNPEGFDSGLTQATQFTINITNDATPVWYYCKQITHCGQGMVGSINAPSSGNTYEAFKAAALAIGSAEPPETDNGPVTGGVGGVATATPAATYSPGSSSSGKSSGTKSSTSSSTSKPTGSSSSGERVVASGSLSLVATVFALAFLRV